MQTTESNPITRDTTAGHLRAASVPNRGIDTHDKRPGVPMETELRIAHGADGRKLAQQQPRVRVLHRMELDKLTPVFGTAQPPVGLSGVIRTIAYSIPEHKPRHWMLLLLADRIDVTEHRLLRAAKWLPLAVPAVALVMGARRRRRSLFQRVFA